MQLQRRRHVVLFRLHDDVPDAVLDEVITMLRSLGRSAGVLEWHVELSLDRRKGRVVVENGLFESESAFDAWAASNAHAAAGTRMAQLADWLVGDYVELA